MEAWSQNMIIDVSYLEIGRREGLRPRRGVRVQLQTLRAQAASDGHPGGQHNSHRQNQNVLRSVENRKKCERILQICKIKFEFDKPTNKEKTNMTDERENFAVIGKI